MVEGGQLFLEGALEDLEVQQQFHVFGEFVTFHGQFHGKVVAVQAFAFAFVMAQGVACGYLVTHREAPDLFGHGLSFDCHAVSQGSYVILSRRDAVQGRRIAYRPRQVYFCEKRIWGRIGGPGGKEPPLGAS